MAFSWFRETMPSDRCNKTRYNAAWSLQQYGTQWCLITATILKTEQLHDWNTCRAVSQLKVGEASKASWVHVKSPAKAKLAFFPAYCSPRFGQTFAFFFRLFFSSKIFHKRRAVTRTLLWHSFHTVSAPSPDYYKAETERIARCWVER